MAQHIPAPSENPNEELSIMVGRDEKRLGSLEAETELAEDTIVERVGAEHKIEELLREGFVPVFPLGDPSQIDHVIDHGLAPGRSLVEGIKELRGTIGRMPPVVDKYMWVVVVDPEAAKLLDPRFTGAKDHGFTGSVGIKKEISKDSVMIIDPKTLEVLHAPRHLMQKLEQMQLKIAGKAKSLGSAEAGEEVENKGITDLHAARKEMQSLLKGGYLPVLPFEASHLDSVMERGIDSQESNVVSNNGWRGTLGRPPVTYLKKCYWAVIVDEKEFSALDPFNGSPSTVSITRDVPAESIVIIDPETGKILHSPEGVKAEVVKSIGGVVGSTREKLKKVA